MSKSVIKIGKYTLNKKELIGKGSYGLVYQAIYDGEEFCAKQILTNGPQKKFTDRELQILRMLRDSPIQNPNIVHIFDVIQNQGDNEVYIIMEYCKGGDLKKEMEYKKKHNQWYTHQESLNIIAQIIKGYKSLYEVEFIHRDLKPANILIQSGFYKLADFGMGRFINSTQSSNVGTPAYSAPQIFFDPNYTNKCDVYSLGVIFYELIFKEKPINGKTQAEQIPLLRSSKQNKITCPRDENIDLRICVLIEQMLSYEEQNRISWIDLFEHPLFNGQQALQTAHIRKSSLLVQKQQVKFQKRPNTPYYHFSKKLYNSLEDAQNLNGLKHLAEIIMSKGDVAYDLAIALAEQQSIIAENQLQILLFCLFSYKYFACSNTMGMCTNQDNYCHNSIIQIFPKFNDLIYDYSKSNTQDSQQMRSIIVSQFGHLNGYYRDSQQFVSQIQELENQHPEFYSKVVERDNDQNNYISYLHWFVFFFNKWFEDTVFPNQNQINKVLTLESAFPLEKFWAKSPSQIITIRKNSL
ncbi:unnamed protein product [Paramecium primaurelia]|uniref:Protein kinase domain-containing protein n=1 Tax=Paramecium primaurelia TaxID=5886 RepID=A0A8S1QLR6_PARPR|nr:unnamed protein product [Paramecium primaurelia]